MVVVLLSALASSSSSPLSSSVLWSSSFSSHDRFDYRPSGLFSFVLELRDGIRSKSSLRDPGADSGARGSRNERKEKWANKSHGRTEKLDPTISPWVSEDVSLSPMIIFVWHEEQIVLCSLSYTTHTSK